MALRGEQIRLRAVERSDTRRAWEFINDREVVEHLGIRYPATMKSEEEWSEKAAAANSYAESQFAIELAESGEYIGNCGLHRVSYEDRSAEVGIVIGAKEQWGKGYGTDALRTLVFFGFRDLNLRRIALDVDANHPAAIKSYERVGFQHEGRRRAEHWLRGQAIDFLAMSILRAEFDELYGAYAEPGEGVSHAPA
ncbi:MAG TPA: GNAT family protein [Dehalococcoidia bacterium]|nr:GNAT family protein [Dehalococcoidia bacterium]